MPGPKGGDNAKLSDADVSSALVAEITGAAGLPAALRARLLTDIVQFRAGQIAPVLRRQAAETMQADGAGSTQPRLQKPSKDAPAPLVAETVQLIADLKASLISTIALIRQVDPVYPLTVATPRQSGRIYADNYPTSNLTRLDLYLSLSGRRA